MKIAFLGLIAFLGISISNVSSAAIVLACDANSHGDENIHTVLKGKAYLDCRTFKVDTEGYNGFNVNREFLVEFEGFGLGIYAGSLSGAIITCPTVRSKAFGNKTFINRKGMEKNGVTEFYGVRVEAGVMVGAQAGVFVNSQGGTCFVTGVELGNIGAAIAGMKMTVKEWK